MINISIVILSYNTKSLTLHCVESFVKQYKKELEKGDFEIIVVDNDSKDGTIQAIQSSKFKVQSYSSKLKVIENDKNYGFAKGCNIGGKAAKEKYILFLNSDTQVLDRGFIKMAEFLENNERVGILGGKLLNIDGSPQPSCGRFYTLFGLFFMLLGLENFLGIRKSPNSISKVDWVSGGCMMIKKSLFEKLSGFDENFFMYIEDMELCFRAQKLGFSTYFYSDINVTHKSLGSGNRTLAIINIYKGILYFYSKHKSYIEYIVAKIFLVTKAIFLIFIGMITLNTNLQDRYKKALYL